MSDAPGSYVSPLESRPEYVQAIGMLTIEIACLERMLANLLGAILNLDMGTAEAIYFSPKANTARVDILANVAATTLLLKTRPSVLAKVESLIKRSRGVIGKRHDIVHSEYRIHPETGNIMISSLSGKGRTLEPFPIEQITRAVKDTRKLIIESLEVVSAVQAIRRPSR